MISIFVSIGILLRFLLSVGFKFRRGETKYFVVALVIWFGTLGIVFLENDSSPKSDFVLLAFLCLTLLIFFKKRLIENVVVTDPLLVVSAIIGLYLCYLSFLDSNALNWSFTFFFYLFVLIIPILITLIISKAGGLINISKVIIFLVLNCWIAYNLWEESAVVSMQAHEAILIGFFIFPFVANVFFLLKFFPHKDNNLRKIRKHAEQIGSQVVRTDNQISLLVLASVTAILMCVLYSIQLLSLSLTVGISFLAIDYLARYRPWQLKN